MSRISLALGSVAIAAAAFVFPAGCANDPAGRTDTNGYNSNYNRSDNMNNDSRTPYGSRGNNAGSNSNYGSSDLQGGNGTGYGNMGTGAGGGGR